MAKARGSFGAAAMAVVVVSLLGSAAVLAGDAPEQPETSALGDLVRASGDNVLTVVVGLVAVIGIYFGRRMGQREIALLLGGAIALTLVAIVVSHLGTQDALDYQEAQAVADADLRMTALQQDHDAAIRRIQNDHQAELEQLANEREGLRIKAIAAITLNDSLDDCLDTISSFGGMAIAFLAMDVRDDRGSGIILANIGSSIRSVVDETTCERPDVDLGDIAAAGGA